MYNYKDKQIIFEVELSKQLDFSDEVYQLFFQSVKRPHLIKEKSKFK